jgi:prolyl oligopeptidase
MMPKLRHLFWLLLILFLSPSSAAAQEGSSKTFHYPEARTTDVKDDFHGHKVADPYRWLEEADSDETRDWVTAQNEISFKWLGEIAVREELRVRLTALWNYEKFGIPWQRGGRYFFSRNDGLQNQAVLYWAEALDAKPAVLIDPNKLSEDGTIALGGRSVSPDGRWFAYGLSSGGSDWSEWHIREIETGKTLDDHLKWIKHSNTAWDKDSKGFFYSRFDEPAEGEALQQVNYYQKLYYHELGTPQSKDRLVYERPDHKEWNFRPRVTDDGRYLIISIGKGTERKNQLLFRDLDDPDGSIKFLVDEFKARFRFIDNDGPLFWIQTDYKAPNSRVIAMDTSKPDEANWKTVIPEAGEVLRSVNLVNDIFIAAYLKDACSDVRLFDLKGKQLGTLDLPGTGSVRGLAGRRHEKETFYRFTSFSDPGTIYRLDMESRKSEIFRRPDLDIDPEAYVTTQVFYPSKDGTKIPLFITHKKGLKKDGANPTMLYGYGGFNIPMSPSFSLERVVWMEMGGVYAQACLRGGGEYGRDWHHAGMKLVKQNTFDDFIAAAEWLIEERYTSTPRLAIYGHSNGGLLVGACMVQRPDLFGACLPAAGVLDMLRFHKFTIGWAWVSDYGSPDEPEEFRALLGYSPYHNVREGVSYPATLVTAADHDDRVVPAHSYKFTARLQAAQTGDAPILIRIETRAGHGAGKPTAKRIEESTDRLAFLIRALGIEETVR